jgi:hypothetical protein
VDRARDHGLWACLRDLALPAAMMWLALEPPPKLPAQAVTTATIRGTVSPGDANVRVTNEANGFSVESQARHGRFVAQGLDVSGSYVVQARRLGFKPEERRGLQLALGHPLELDIVLPPLVATLDTMRVTAKERTSGTATTVSDSLLHRLPTLNRDMYDFARLAPQISTKVGVSTGGISAAGVNTRFNNYLIDGATDRFPTGNSPTAFAGGKSVPLDAVKEYQVLVAPFDVRYGDFAGALVNAVTKAGTNELHGSSFVYNRNDGLARAIRSTEGGDTSNVPYQRTQFGFAVGGPIIRDRLHFFIAPEFQRFTSPASGPFLGQAPASAPVTAEDVARFTSIMRGYGLDPGSAGPTSVGSPFANLFARFDLALPSMHSRAVLLDSYARTDNVQFSRSTASDTFPLSSYRYIQAFASHLTTAQLHTNLRGGGYNALTLSYRTVWSENRPDVREPIVQVRVSNGGTGTEVLKAGSQEAAHGVSTRSRSIGLTENLTITGGDSHQFVFGAQTEVLRLERGGLRGSYGSWTFGNLDAFQNGVADSYQIRQDLGSAAVPFRGVQYGAYIGDEWRAADRLSITAGVRGDAFAMLDHAPYNSAVDAQFGRRTDRMPETRIHVSPRLGFNWDLFGTGRDQLRGGAGIFTGRFPAAWAFSAVYSYGGGTGLLRCGALAGSAGPAPNFVRDYRAAPTTCANGAGGAASQRDVDLLDPHLRLAQAARVSLGYDRRLPWDLTATVEGLITRNISDFVFVNLNLKDPRGVDRRGRVMYGTVDTAGMASADTVSGAYSEVIDLRNVSGNHAVQADVRLEKRFSRSVGATASYTFTRVRDVQMPLRNGQSTGIINWSAGRVVSGRHDDLSTGVSMYDLPHRVVVTGTFRAPWRLTTDFSVYYVGESGSPFTYVAGGLGRRGDLNADGAVGNDPLYIPTNAGDTSQIRFSGFSAAKGDTNTDAAQVQRVAKQQQAFEQLIATTGCLRRQRGQIMRRNSCREPWSHTSIASMRQTIPVAGAHALTVQLDVFNVLNVLNRNWGQYRTANPTLLTQMGETTGSQATAQPVFSFDPTKALWTTAPTESGYQLQLAVRYSF